MALVSTGQITIIDVNDGPPGPALTLTSTGQGFTFVDGVASPAQQYIGLQVVRYATTDPVQWYASNGAALITDMALLSMAAYLTGVYGAGDGDVAYMDIGQFGSGQQVVITAVAGGLTATCTLLRLDGTTAAAGATVGATIGVNLDGQITPANAPTFIAGDAIVAGMVNSRGLSILDAAGNVILSAGATLAASTLNVPGTVTGVPAGWQNSNVSLSSSGALSGAGGGQVTLPGMGLATYRVGAWGLSAVGAPIGAGLYNATTGAMLVAGAAMYRVVKINRATGVLTNVGGYNTLAGAPYPANMAAALNAIGNDHIVVVFTYDEPQGFRLTAGLADAMYRHGASKTVFGSSNFAYRSAYVLVGIGACGEGNGAEVYQGAIDNDPNAWVDMSFSVVNGSIVGVSSTSTPKSLSDYGYTGSMTATTGAPNGSLVGSTPAQTVESNAVSAYSQVTDASLGLSQRMRANADNVLGGVLVANAVSAPAGLRVGSVTWDAAGAITGGVGVAVTPKGIFARNASKTSFVLDATTGSATYAGDLVGANITGATGTFSGSLTAETLGSMAQPPITLTTSGNVTVPVGMTTVRYELIGGGGGGGGGATSYVAGYGGGGGAGGYMAGTMAVTPGASLAIVIGGGGAGGANATAGGAGVASTLAGVVSAAGGVAGGGTAGGFGTGGAAGASVPASTSTPGLTAVRVYDGVNTTYAGYGVFNGEALFNGAGFPRFGVTGAGGSTPKGSGGASINTGVGIAGSGYGSGGGGGGGSLATSASAAGGAGRQGVAVLTFFNNNGVVLQTQLEALKTALVLQGITVT